MPFKSKIHIEGTKDVSMKVPPQRYNIFLRGAYDGTYIGWQHIRDLLIVKAVHAVGSTAWVVKSNEGMMEGDTSSLALTGEISSLVRS